MRTNYIKYILGALCMTGILNTSCVDEESGSDPVAPNGQGYVSLNIDMGNLPSETRSGDEQGTLDELKIYSVRVVLYDGTDPTPGSCKVEYVFDLDIQTPNSWTNSGSVSGWLEGGDFYQSSLSGSMLQFITAAQRVADKPYKMLVLINGKDITITNNQKSIYNVTEKGCFLYQLYEAVKADINPLTGTVKGSKGIFMSNHQDLVEVTKAQLKKTAGEANENPIQIQVDRLVAKVTVKHANNFSFPDGVDPQSATWGLAITNQKTHWMRKMIGNEGSQTSMANLYAEDPNYAVANINMEDNFNHILFSDNGSVSLSPTNITNKFGNYEYLLENTISSKTSSENKTFLQQATHIVVGYKYTPANFAANESYYIYNHQVISKADMIAYKNGAPIPTNLTGLDNAISQTNQVKYPLDGTGSEYFEINAIRFCPQGQVYYYFPIRHFNQPEGSLGYYGVVRNNIYEVTINSLNVPETANQYLSAEISVMPWAMRGQTNRIGVSVTERKWAEVKIYHYHHFGGDNLYQMWTQANYGTGIEYQTIMAGVGSVINCDERQMQDEFRTLPPYPNINYIYSIPGNSLTVSEDTDLNNLYLIYSQGFFSTGFITQIPICFIKTDGTILKATGTDEQGNFFTGNPRKFWLASVVSNPTATTGAVFIKHLQSFYEIAITDNANNQYKITAQDACAVLYDEAASTGSNIVVIGDINSPLNEPINISKISGGIWTADSNSGIAIICVLK